MATYGEVFTTNGMARFSEEGDGPPVLLLHGIYAGAGAHEWDALVPLLSPRCAVRNAELVGFGESDHPAMEFTPAVIAESVRALIHAMPDETTVVASSLTGAYALRELAHAETPRPLVLVTPTGLGKTQSGSGLVGAIAETALRRTPFGDVLAGALTSRPSVKWFLSNQAYAKSELVDGSVVDAYHRSGAQAGAKYPLVAFVSGRLGLPLDPTDVARVRPTVIWAEAQKFTNDEERERWAGLGAHVISLPSGQPQAEEPQAVADAILAVAASGQRTEP